MTLGWGHGWPHGTSGYLDIPGPWQRRAGSSTFSCRLRPLLLFLLGFCLPTPSSLRQERDWTRSRSSCANLAVWP